LPLRIVSTLTLGLGAVDEIVERLVRRFLAGEDEIIAGVRQHCDDRLAGEQIVAEIDGAQRGKPFAVLGVPALDGVTFAVLLFRAVLRRDEFGKQRHHLGMARGDRRRRQHGVIALDVAVGALAPQAMRAAQLLRAEILGAVPGDQGSLAKPAKGRPQRRRDEHLLHALETGLQQRRIGGVEHVADVVVGRDFLDPEQSLAVRAPLALLQGALERQKRRALQEKKGECRQPEIRHRDVAAASLPGVRKARAHRA
jgi:hypothetical protein